MRNVIKTVYSTAFGNFHVGGGSLNITRALHVLTLRSNCPSYHCFCTVSSPTRITMAEAMNIPADSHACQLDLVNYEHKDTPENSAADGVLSPLKGLSREDGGCYGRSVNLGGGCDPALLALLDGDSCGLSPHGRFRSGGRVSDQYNSLGRCGESSNILRYSFDAGNIQRVGAVDVFESEVVNKGSELLEVFSVRVVNCENSVYLYGTIYFDGIVHLYNRQSSDSELVSRDSTLSLTGPRDSLDVNDQSFLELDLKDKDGNLFPSNKSAIDWLFGGMDDYLPDERMIGIFYGNSISVAVYYTIFKNALNAKVEVEVLKGDDEDGADQVYGRVAARYSNYDYSTDEQNKYFQTILFDKSENNYVEVGPGKPIIPLSRYVVAVPTTSYLIIEVNLWDYDKLKKPDYQIAKGTVVFQPKTESVTLNDIQGDSGLVRVTVAWMDLITDTS